MKLTFGDFYKMASTPQKLVKDRYHVVPRTILFIFHGEKVLLQKGAANKKINSGLWNGLGGHIERGEDILSAAHRELAEEAGISCSDLKLNGTVMIDVNHAEGILLFVFSGEEIKGKPNHSSEGLVEWFPINNLPKQEIVDDVPDLIDHVLKSGKNGKLFSLLYSYDQVGNRITTGG